MKIRSKLNFMIFLNYNNNLFVEKILGSFRTKHKMKGNAFAIV